MSTAPPSKPKRQAKYSYQAPNLRAAILSDTSIPSHDDSLRNPEAWLELLKWHYKTFPMNQNLAEIENCYLDYYYLYLQANSRGGWLRMTGLGEWESAGQGSGLKETYEKYLFSFEKTYNPTTTNKFRHEKERVDIRSINPELLTSVQVQSLSEVRASRLSILQDSIDAVEIILLRDFSKALDLNHSLFSMEGMLGDVHEFDIEVLTQSRQTRFYKANKVSKAKQPLKEFLSKVQAESQCGSTPSDEISAISSSIDISNWQPQVNELRRKLPKRLLWSSDDDALEVVREHVKGLTLPQLRVGTMGSWIGGRQETLRFCSVNINHGPGDCEWWALDSRCLEAFRYKVMNSFFYDIFREETKWWPDEDWCLANGFKLRYIIQKPGDIIFIGIGTLHWSRYLNPSVCSSWNVGLKSLRQFEAAFDRLSLNSQLGLTSKVPLHTLALDLLNFELPNLPKDLTTFLKNRISIQFAQDNTKLFQVLPKSQKPIIYATINVPACEACSQETFYTYVRCWFCCLKRGSPTFEHVEALYCLACYTGHQCSYPRFEFFAKFASEDHAHLIMRIDRYLEAGELSDSQEALDCYNVKHLNIYQSAYNGIENSFAIPPLNVLVIVSGSEPERQAGENRPKKRYGSSNASNANIIPTIRNSPESQPGEREDPAKRAKIGNSEIRIKRPVQEGDEAFKRIPMKSVK